MAQPKIILKNNNNKGVNQRQERHGEQEMGDPD